MLGSNVDPDVPTCEAIEPKAGGSNLMPAGE